jgi:hypothetical protein
LSIEYREPQIDRPLVLWERPIGSQLGEYSGPAFARDPSETYVPYRSTGEGRHHKTRRPCRAPDRTEDSIAHQQTVASKYIVRVAGEEDGAAIRDEGYGLDVDGASVRCDEISRRRGFCPAGGRLSRCELRRSERCRDREKRDTIAEFVRSAVQISTLD